VVRERARSETIVDVEGGDETLVGQRAGPERVEHGGRVDEQTTGLAKRADHSYSGLECAMVDVEERHDRRNKKDDWVHSGNYCWP